MIDPLVRTASPSDVGQLMLLEGEARAALIDQRGGNRWLGDHPMRGERWSEFIDVPAVFVAVAHIETVLVGYIVATQVDALARIDEVYVTPGARELGFGDALLAAATAAMRAAGATTLDGEALPGDRETKNLYERAGIKARLIVVSTAL